MMSGFAITFPHELLVDFTNRDERRRIKCSLRRACVGANRWPVVGETVSMHDGMGNTCSGEVAMIYGTVAHIVVDLRTWEGATHGSKSNPS